MDQLAQAESAEAGAMIIREIRGEWMKSGSAAIDLLLSRGEEALHAGNHAAAIEHLTAAIDHAPDFAEPYHLRATAYYLTGNVGPALADLGRALQLNPQHFGAMQGLAVLLEEIGRREQALEVFRAVLVINPTDPDIVAAVARLERSLDGQTL